MATIKNLLLNNKISSKYAVNQIQVAKKSGRCIAEILKDKTTGIR
jgi:hypothetical protein